MSIATAERASAQTPGDEAIIRVDHVTHNFVEKNGKVVRALNDVSLAVRPGEFIALVGPSGCGKTTLLNMIGSLLAQSEGSIQVLGQPNGRIDRRVGYMFARDGLLPWRTALANVMLGPEIRGVSRTKRADAARQLLSEVGLEGFENAYPARLSQGMRQRVAIARTLAVRPELILLDEPFAALDAHTRTRVQARFTELWEETASTVVMVTHDIAEAVALSDRIIVLSGRPGQIVADITVPFVRPRDIEEIRFTHEFADISERIWTLLKQH